MQMLLDSGADINFVGGVHDSALAAAAGRGHQSIVRVLLDAGADVNLTGSEQATPITAAAWGGTKT